MNEERSSADAQRPTRELVLMTQSYPYGVYADFLADEIPHLAEVFDVVTVVPLNPKGPLQPLPDNVSLDRSLVNSTARSERLRHLLSVMGVVTLVRELLRGPRSARPGVLPRTVLAAGQYTAIRRWAARRGTPDVAYTYWLGAPAAALADEWPRTPVVSRVHRGDLYWENFDPPGIPFQRHAIEGSEFVASVSEQGRDYLVDHHPGLQDRIVVERLGVVGSEGIAPASDDGVLRVLSISSLSEVKRPLLVGRVVRELGALVPRVEWHHFGDGPLRGEVERATADMPDGTEVFLHGQTDHARLLEAVGRGPWDVFVNVSSSEGVPVSIMEVLGSGIPVVATDVGGVAEVVDPRLNRLVGPDSPAERIAAEVMAVIDPSIPGRQERKEACESVYSAERNYRAFALRLGELADR